MRILVASVVLATLTGVAAAQDSGSTMGGGDWSGGGGGGYASSSSSDYSSSSSSSDYTSGYDSSSSGGGAGGGGGGVIVGAIVLVGLFVVWDAMKQRARGGAPVSPVADADVTVLRIALDARVRPYVQHELDRIARTADTATQAGLLTMLHEVALILRRTRDAWVYGGAYNHPMSGKQVAQQAFQEQVAKARSTYRHEMVRNQAGTITTGDRPERAIRSDEGPGLVLVTLIVAARVELFTVHRIGDGDNLRRALEVLSGLTTQSLIAVEIVWSPASPDDRMSSVELEAALPGEIFPIHGAMVGKAVCSHCAGPFPAELLSCPHCGAPARAADAA
jgi:uncharacterized membrane protein